MRGWGPGFALALGVATACTSMETPPTTLTAADSADQVGYGVTHILTADGVRRIRLVADSAYAYLGPQRHELFGITVTFYSPDGVDLHAHRPRRHERLADRQHGGPGGRRHRKPRGQPPRNLGAAV